MKNISLENNIKPMIVDDQDFSRLKGYKWKLRKNAIHCTKAPKVAIHRLIMGARRGEIVDHINGDIFDNRHCNLRFVNAQQNSWNQGIRSNNTSGFKGVSWIEGLKKYRAYISYKGKRTHLGVFNTPEEAAQAYTEASNKYFKEYSLHNSREVQIPQKRVHKRKDNIWVGDHIKFKLDKRIYTVQARNDRFIICTRPFNIRKTGMYTIIDLQKQIRGADSSKSYKRYETKGKCLGSLKRLSTNPEKVSFNNEIPLAIELVIHHSKVNMKACCKMCNLDITETLLPKEEQENT